MRTRLIACLTLLLLLPVPLLRGQSDNAVRDTCIAPDSVISEAMKYLGAPYRWGGKSPKGFDCAGFTRYIYGKFGVSLPPSAGPQYKMGIPVGRDELSVGDLVFFSGRRHLKQIGHVGIVTSIDEDGFDFIHASSTGIRITSSREKYYVKRYIGACRVIDRDEVAEAGLSLKADSTANDTLLTIAMVGDMMLGTLYPSEQLPVNAGRNLFDDTKAILRTADIAVGNCEGVLCDSMESTKEECVYCYSFRMPPSYAKYFKEAGFDFLSLANNHSNDFGRKGLKSTMRLFDSLDIAYAGVRSLCQTAILQRDSLVYGFCAFGTNDHNYSLLDSAEVKAVIRGLRDSCDILVVSFHGGGEGKAYDHLPEGMEIFLDEERGDLRTFAHLCIDEGADLVYGHGPHVCRAVEVYKGHFIAYSLGNFCTPTGISVSGTLGYAPIITVRIDRNGYLVDGKIHSFIQSFRVGPRADRENKVAQFIRALTIDDIVTPGIVINDDGTFRLAD